MSAHNEGITLIALIITIIVMLILVAVTINVLIKSDLIGATKTAAKRWQDEADKEKTIGSEIVIDGKTYSSIDEYINGVQQPLKYVYYNGEMIYFLKDSKFDFALNVLDDSIIKQEVAKHLYGFDSFEDMIDYKGWSELEYMVTRKDELLEMRGSLAVGEIDASFFDQEYERYIEENSIENVSISVTDPMGETVNLSNIGEAMGGILEDVDYGDYKFIITTSEGKNIEQIISIEPEKLHFWICNGDESMYCENECNEGETWGDYIYEGAILKNWNVPDGFEGDVEMQIDKVEEVDSEIYIECTARDGDMEGSAVLRLKCLFGSFTGLDDPIDGETMLKLTSPNE